MAHIHAVMTKQDGESVAEFKGRCGAILYTIDAGPDAFSIGRFAVTDNKLEGSTVWGLSFGDELPSETCVIASYDVISARNVYHAYSAEELETASRNPDLQTSVVVTQNNRDRIKKLSTDARVMTKSSVGQSTNILGCYVQVTGDASDEEDEGLEGFYYIEVYLAREVVLNTLTSSEKSEIAEAVLNEFHAKQGISTLDDFSIEVLLPDGSDATEGDDVPVTGLIVRAVYMEQVEESDLPFEVKAGPDVDGASSSPHG